MTRDRFTLAMIPVGAAGPLVVYLVLCCALGVDLEPWRIAEAYKAIGLALLYVAVSSSLPLALYALARR